MIKEDIMNKKVVGLGLSLMMVCGMVVGCTDGENARYQDILLKRKI